MKYNLYIYYFIKMNIQLKGYKLFNKIGKGSFGEIYLAVKENNDDELLVAKVIDVSTIKDKNLLNYLNQEKEIMEILAHPNIIRLHNFCETNNHYFYIMEYCNGGTLSDLLIKYKEKFRKPFSIEIVQYFMRQLIEGIKYMHSLNIIHRDLKLANILIHFKNISKKIKNEEIDFNELDDNDFLNSTIKIIDFGFATKLGPGKLATSYVGTPYNMDPSIIKEYQNNGGFEKFQGYNEKADIWSLGTICYQMFTGVPLFSLYNLDTLIQKIEEGNYSIPINIEISEEIISFLNSMLKYKAELRSSSDELSHHDFLIKNVKDFKKANPQVNPKEKDISYILINAMKNSFIINNNKKMENSKETYLNYIENLYNDYKSAKQYFKENDLPEREKDAQQKCYQIENIKRQLNSGIEIYIYLNNLPKRISPEYIYGCSIMERNKKFKEILSKYRAEKNLLEVKLKNIENQNNKDEYEKNKEKYIKLKVKIQDLEEKSKNIWVPSPKYIKETKKQPKEIISFDKSVFKIKIQIKRVDNINDGLDLIVTFVINEEKTLIKKVTLNSGNNYDEWIWILSAEEWMNIDNNINNFILGIKFDKFQQNNQNKYFDVSKIKDGKGIIINDKILNNKRINITILPILPEGEKSIILEKKEILYIKKLYPPFELKSKNDYLIMKPLQINFNVKHNKDNH